MAAHGSNAHATEARTACADEPSSAGRTIVRALALPDSTVRRAATGSQKLPHSLFSQLVATLDPRSRRVLMLSAFLPTITPETVTRLSGDARTPDILEQLSRTFPFFFREPTQPATYSHHPLLRSYLRSLARATLPLPKVSDLLWTSLDAYEAALQRAGLTSKRHHFPLFAPAPAIRINVLGGLNILRDGIPLTCRRRPVNKPLALLIAIVVMGGTNVPLQCLAALLWPKAKSDCAQARMTITLRRVRRLLGDCAAIRVDNGMVSLNLALVTVDAFELAQRLHDPELVEMETVEACQRVLDAYPGTLLPDETVDAEVLRYREQLAAQFTKVVLQIGGRLQHAGDLVTVRSFYRETLVREPLAIGVRVKLWELDHA
jgi:hypothetical protein